MKSSETALDKLLTAPTFTQEKSYYSIIHQTIEKLEELSEFHPQASVSDDQPPPANNANNANKQTVESIALSDKGILIDSQG